MARPRGATMSLPIVVPPVRGESTPGYAVRLAEANVWDDAASMFKDMGKGIFIHQLKSLGMLKNSLMELTELPLTELSINDDKFSALYYDDARCFKNLRALTPRVCPRCIKESCTLQDCWELHGIDMCLKHNVSLVSKCPNCQCSLDWHSSLLQGECNHCHSNLEQSTPLEAPPVYLTKLLKHGPKKQKLLLRDLFLCSQRITRPFDSMLENYERPNRDVSWAKYLEDAYELLSNKEYFLSWINALYSNRNHLKILGRRAILLPAMELIDNLYLDWPITKIALPHMPANPEIAFELNEVSSPYANIRPSRLLGAPSNKSLQSQTDIYGVARVIGLTKGNPVTKAVAYQLITPTNQAKVSRNSIFDLSTISADFKAISTLTPYDGPQLKPLSHYHPIWPLFNSTGLDMLNYIKNGKLPGSINSSMSSFLGSFEPQIFSLFRCLHLQLHKIQNEELTLNQARKIMGISWNDAQALIEENILNYTTDGRGTKNLVKGEDVIRALRTWVFLPRVCKIHGLNRTTVRLQLEKLEISPVISTNIYTKNLRIMTAIQQLIKS